MSSSSVPIYLQRTITLPSYKRGLHLVTREINQSIHDDLRQISVGICHLFIQHTSASLTINENTASEVRLDIEDQLNRMVSEKERWRHDDEGSDDMPAHFKSSMFGSSVTIPITDGRLNLGTWQGIMLGEHRNHGGSRRIVATMHGMKK